MYRVQETDDLSGLTELFLKNGLEVSSAPKESIALTKCWEIIETETGKRLGGLHLEKRGEEYIIVGIYVDSGLRNKGLGKMLVDEAAEEVRRLGGSRIMLIAKAPEFFKKTGFTKTEDKEFSSLINCDNCEQLNKSCFPAVMRLNL